MEVVNISDIFDRINDVHNVLEHGCRDKLVPETGKKYLHVSNRVVKVHLATSATSRFVGRFRRAPAKREISFKS